MKNVCTNANSRLPRLIQFLLLYLKFKDLAQTKTFWGDEIEYHLLHLDPNTKIPKLQPNTEYMFKSIQPDIFVLRELRYSLIDTPRRSASSPIAHTDILTWIARTAFEH